MEFLHRFLLTKLDKNAIHADLSLHMNFKKTLPGEKINRFTDYNCLIHSKMSIQDSVFISELFSFLFLKF